MTYPLQNDKDGVRFFTSASGNKYEILIFKTSYFPQFTWDNNVVTVIVRADAIGEYDNRIMNTVLNLLIRIIKDDPTTILYWICHSEDGLHQNRHRYFHMLYLKAMRTNLDGLHPQLNELGIKKLDFILPESGIHQKEYLSYIISDKHPDFEQVLAEIELIIDKLKADKLSAEICTPNVP